MTSPRLLLGDCVERLRELPEESVDAIVCDPPYGLGKEPPIADVLEAWLADRVYVPTGGGFMGKTWDAFVPDLAVWRECFRVLKPGGYLLAFGGTRTLELVGIGIRLAGFERRDLLTWLYGSGFPKSLDVAKAITKTGDPLGDEREKWEGWGTALKPAVEPIVVARKPLMGTVAENVLAHGTGALNIDGCRIAFQSDEDEAESKEKNRHADFESRAPDDRRIFGRDIRARAEQGNYDAPGRWPANVLLSHTDDCVLVGERQVEADGHWPSSRPIGSAVAGASGHVGQEDLEERAARGEMVEVWDCADGCPVRLLDAQTGTLTSGARAGGDAREDRESWRFAGGSSSADSGGASRFFYTAKTSSAERNAGLHDFPERVASVGNIDGETGRDATRPGNAVGGQQARIVAGLPPTRPRANDHPTVKPVALMRWLVRLVARPGAVVCDPFLGSGTTGIACGLEGIDFVGIEREPEYLAIAEARIRFWAEHGDDTLRVVSDRDAADRLRCEIADAGQLDLFG